VLLSQKRGSGSSSRDRENWGWSGGDSQAYGAGDNGRGEVSDSRGVGLRGDSVGTIVSCNGGRDGLDDQRGSVKQGSFGFICTVPGGREMGIPQSRSWSVAWW